MESKAFLSRAVKVLLKVSSAQEIFMALFTLYRFAFYLPFPLPLLLTLSTSAPSDDCPLPDCALSDFFLGWAEAAVDKLVETLDEVPGVFAFPLAGGRCGR